MRKINRKNRTGFSLAEAMMATVVLGIAAAGVLLPFTSAASVRAEGTRRTLAAKLASDLMERITTKSFHDPDGSIYHYQLGPDAGETAIGDFDNIDDFDGYTESAGQVTNAAGAIFTGPDYANFSRDVTCQYVHVTVQSDTFAPNFILVTVRVHYKGGEMAVINRLIGR